MAVPRNRHSNSRKNMRRAHHAKKAKNIATCDNCGAQSLPHRICSSCGQYGGRAMQAAVKA
ncbi:MAG: 50S ribosomal protein L32 [Waddliaceae bacterium]|nr:50S ribosomal protein L32 [Waddliaceae bacterium]